MRGAGHVARMGEIRNMRRILFGQDKMKRPLGRPWRNINKVNFKVNLKHQDMIMWTGLISLTTGTRGELLQ
jgi:hypothetical protein